MRLIGGNKSDPRSSAWVEWSGVELWSGSEEGGERGERGERVGVVSRHGPGDETRVHPESERSSAGSSAADTSLDSQIYTLTSNVYHGPATLSLSLPPSLSLSTSLSHTHFSFCSVMFGMCVCVCVFSPPP